MISKFSAFVFEMYFSLLSELMKTLQNVALESDTFLKNSSDVKGLPSENSPKILPTDKLSVPTIPEKLSVGLIERGVFLLSKVSSKKILLFVHKL